MRKIDRNVGQFLIMTGIIFILSSSIILTDAIESEGISSPPDVVYYYGSVGNTITWNVLKTVTLTGAYYVYRNGTAIAWGYSNVITINIDGLDIGVYNCTIQTWSYHGINSSKDTVIVSVELHPSPIIQFLIEYQFIVMGIVASIAVIIGTVVISRRIYHLTRLRVHRVILA